MFDLFNKRRLQEVRNALKISQNSAEHWENKYKETVEACLRNDSKIQQYLEFIYKDKYFQFELFDLETNQSVLHKMKIDKVSYNGGVISFNVHEGETETHHSTTFECLRHFKQISKKTYLS